jgi:hypothetical protein
VVSNLDCGFVCVAVCFQTFQAREKQNPSASKTTMSEDSSDNEVDIAKRRGKNRVNARRSRERKRVMLDTLQQEHWQLHQENKMIKSDNEKLREAIDTIKSLRRRNEAAPAQAARPTSQTALGAVAAPRPSPPQANNPFVEMLAQQVLLQAKTGSIQANRNPASQQTDLLASLLLANALKANHNAASPAPAARPQDNITRAPGLVTAHGPAQPSNAGQPTLPALALQSMGQGVASAANSTNNFNDYYNKKAAQHSDMLALLQAQDHQGAVLAQFFPSALAQSQRQVQATAPAASGVSEDSGGRKPKLQVFHQETLNGIYNSMFGQLKN